MVHNETRLEIERKISYEYTSSNKEKIELNEIAFILGYKQPRSGAFYKRIDSLIAYGLVEGREVFKIITELGKDVAHSFDYYYHREEFYRQAVLNVSLWNKLYKRFQKNLPENIEAALEKIITGAEPSEIKKVEKDIRR